MTSLLNSLIDVTCEALGRVLVDPPNRDQVASRPVTQLVEAEHWATMYALAADGQLDGIPVPEQPTWLRSYALKEIS